ncbi:zinc transporter ZIP1-like [Pollicipes pollicipes]|uniref:zinc transporter ZIP1-like n=1 Tax=Pollicipes pollicipes TaxID=41117 RepID=UPI0018854987|nr:zinc transporter ZIP1-like [Pollicipes pollicipes]
MDDVLKAKLVALAVLGLGSLLAGCLPMTALAVLRRGKRGHQAALRVSPDHPIFSFFLCFGAGVLLSTLLCHMVPESLESWSDIQSNDSVVANDVPLPSILIGVGFFLVYLLEEVAHKLLHGAQPRAAARVQPDVALVSTPAKLADPGDGGLDAGALEVQHGHDGHAGSGEDHVHGTGGDEGHSHGAAIASAHGGTLVTMLLLVALSFHAVLEGIAVGAEENTSNVYLMLAAVSSHKFILVFILGLEMLTSSLRPVAQVACVLVFTVATMLGIGIGIGVLQLEVTGLAHDVSLMVMQTLASGTLMYVCFMEVLTRERSRQGHAMARFACTAAGFVLIAILVSLVTEPEEDEGAEDHRVRIW